MYIRNFRTHIPRLCIYGATDSRVRPTDYRKDKAYDRNDKT